LYRVANLNPLLGDAVYAGAIYEIGKMWGAASGTPSLPNDVSVAVIVKSVIGPIYGGGSIGESGHRRWYFGLGRVF
jgi:NTE family protein